MTDVTTPVPSGTALGKLLAGYLASFCVLLDGNGAEVLGQLTAAPDANSISGRLKTIATQLAGTIAVSLASAPLPPGAALDATLQSILTKLGTARAETLWTDDTGGFFVRVDNAGAISWTDTSGNASSAPGTGSRPAAGATVLLDKSSWQATAAGTGFSIGDYLNHLVTTDPQSGAVIGSFWINTTTNAKLAAAPASASISPVSPLATNAATQTTLAAVLTAVQALGAAATYALVTPSDTVALTATTRAITIGGAGNLTVKRADGTTIGPIPAVAGQTLAIAATYVMATGTSATGILAQY